MSKLLLTALALASAAVPATSSAATATIIERRRKVAFVGMGAPGYRGVGRFPGKPGTLPGPSSEPDRILPVAVLGGELAVPCTRDPLQRG